VSIEKLACLNHTLPWPADIMRIFAVKQGMIGKQHKQQLTPGMQHSHMQQRIDSSHAQMQRGGRLARAAYTHTQQEHLMLRCYLTLLVPLTCSDPRINSSWLKMP